MRCRGAERCPWPRRSTISLLFLKRLVDDIRQRCVAVENIDVEPFILQGPHGIEAFLFTWTAAAHPNSDVIEFAVCLRLAEPVDDPAERLLHVRKVGNGSPDDDVPDARQGADLFRE